MDMADVEWDGIRHWKTWALAALDTCISTTKCRPTGPCGRTVSPECRKLPASAHSGSSFLPAVLPGVVSVEMGQPFGMRACTIRADSTCSDAAVGLRLMAEVPFTMTRQRCAPGRRYALLYFLPLIIFRILGRRHDRAVGEGAGFGAVDDDDAVTAGRGARAMSKKGTEGVRLGTSV